MEKIRMSHVSLQRILAIASRADELSVYEISTLKYLVSQCSEEEKQHMVKRFGEKLQFLNNSDDPKDKDE